MHNAAIQHPMSIRICYQLLDIKEQIGSVTDKLGGSSSDKILLTTILFEICRNLFTQYETFKIHISAADPGGKQAVQIQIILNASDILPLHPEHDGYQKHDGNPELREHQENQGLMTISGILGLDIDIIQTVFDHFDEQVVGNHDFHVITLSKHCSRKSGQSVKPV